MVNLGLNLSSLLGIILAVAGAALYFMRSWRPKLARDHDIFFAAVGLLCGGILLFQGWRLDPILAFGQFLLTGSAIFFAVESIRLRGLATSKAKERSAPIVDDRYVSNDYYAELDEREPLEEDIAVRPQIRGSRDPRPSRYEDYEDERPRRPPSSRRSAQDRLMDRPSSVERPPRRRRPRPESRSRSQSYEWEASIERDERPTRSRNNAQPTSSIAEDLDRWEAQEERKSRPRRTRPPEESGYRTRTETRPDLDSTSTDYADYRPIDTSEDDFDRSNNFDQ